MTSSPHCSSPIFTDNPVASSACSTSLRLITSEIEVGEITINMLQHSQAKPPMPTAYDDTSDSMEWARGLHMFLFINNFEYIPQLDDAQTHDTEVTLYDIVAHTTDGAAVHENIRVNDEAIAALNAEKNNTPETQSRAKLYTPPPPLPHFCPNSIFQGRGVGVYILRPPAAQILYAPPFLYTPHP